MTEQTSPTVGNERELLALQSKGAVGADGVLRERVLFLEQRVEISAVGVHANTPRTTALVWRLHLLDERHGAGVSVDAVREDLVSSHIGAE